MFLIDFTFLANFLQQIPQNLNLEPTNLFLDENWELKAVQKCQYKKMVPFHCPSVCSGPERKNLAANQKLSYMENSVKLTDQKSIFLNSSLRMSFSSRINYAIKHNCLKCIVLLEVKL